MSAPKASEPFVQLPHRLFRAWEREELSPPQFLLAARLAFRCHRDGGETAFRLGVLKAECGYTLSAEQLRQDLHELGRDWFVVESPGVGKSVWRVRPNAVELEREPGQPPSDLQQGTPPTLEVESELLEVADAGIPQEQAASAFTVPASVGGSDSPIAEQSREEATASAEVANEIAASLAFAHLHGSLFDQLVGEVRNKDSSTLNVWSRQGFDRLPDAAYVGALERLRAERRKKGVRNEAGFVSKLLADYKRYGVIDRVPEEPAA